MIRRTLMLAVLSAAWIGLAGCEQDQNGGGATSQPSGSSLSNVQQQAQDMAARGLDYLQQKKEEYEKRVGPELDRLSKRVDAVKQKLSDVAESAKPEIEKQLDELSKQVEVAREKFEKVKEASGPAWEEARKGLDAAVDRLRQALGEPPPPPPPAEDKGIAMLRGMQGAEDVERIKRLAFEFSADHDLDADTMQATLLALQRRFTAASERLGPAQLRKVNDRTVRVEFQPTAVMDRIGEKLIATLAERPGVVAFRILAEPDTEYAAQWAEMRTALEEKGPEAASSEEVAWFKIADPVTFLGFKSKEHLESYDLAKHKERVAGRYGEDYYVLAYITAAQSLVFDAGVAWQIIGAQPQQDAQEDWGVAVGLNDAGAERLRDLTRANIGRLLGVFVDDAALTTARINSVVNGNAFIGGKYTREEAAGLAAIITGPPLPVALKMTMRAEPVTQ